MLEVKKHIQIVMWVVVMAAVVGMLALAAGCAAPSSGGGQAASSEQGQQADSSSADGSAGDNADESASANADASQATSEAGGAANAGSATTAEWSLESDCTVCHEMQHTSQGNTAMKASLHASLDCAACHSDAEALGKVHAKADPSKAAKLTRLRRSNIDQEFCLTCHGSLEELATKTEGKAMLTDRNGTTVNPHAIPVNDDHAKGVTCANCHKMHSEQDSAATLVDADELCISCHHENVFECHTCHD